MSIGICLIASRPKLPTVPDSLSIFHFEYCALPCWIGITPGFTTLNEAKRLIHFVYGNSSEYEISEDFSNLSGGYVTRKADGFQFSIGLTIKDEGSTFDPIKTGHSTIDNIDLFQTETPEASLIKTTVQDYTSLLGSPVSIVMLPGEGVSAPALLYPKNNIGIVIANIYDKEDACFKVQPDTHAGITLFSQPVNFTAYGGPRVWQGFDACYKLIDGVN